AGSLKNLVTQPYDKINQDMQREYYEKSPYNYCRLILPMDENRYQAVHQRIYEWMSERILSKDESPSVFVCCQEFKLNGKTYTRTGLIAALRLYSYSEGVVFPHETTYSAPKADRLNMLRTIQKDLEPVFLIYSDPERVTVNLFAEVTKEPPAMEVEDQFQVKHKLWQVTDPAKISALQKAFEKKTMVITDGHHRYESALSYRDERRAQEEWTEDAAFNFHMSYMVPVQDEGLIILPAHRLLRKFELADTMLNELKNYFEISELQPNVEAVEKYLVNNKREHAFCVYTGTKALGLRLSDEEKILQVSNTIDSSPEVRLLDVVILRDVIFKSLMKIGELKIDEDILYERSTRVAMEKVAGGEAKVAFLLNPINPEVIWRIAQKRQRLPEKSTDFYPKPVSGLVMMDIARGEKL
ncbi:MAG: DUF1015 domain-containing protein, partial [Candidatus Bathyarchaeia archaeon]